MAIEPNKLAKFAGTEEAPDLEALVNAVYDLLDGPSPSQDEVMKAIDAVRELDETRAEGLEMVAGEALSPDHMGGGRG